MTTPIALLEPQIDSAVARVLSDDETEPTTHGDSAPPAHRSLADDWHHEDPIEELLHQLEILGREGQARLIRSVLAERADIDGLRTYVAARWSDDWASEEDSLYDSEAGSFDD